MVKPLACALLLSTIAGTALAQTGLTQLPQANQQRSSIATPGGTGVITGRVGNTQTTTLPGGVQGQVGNNGNGTSTIIEQGQGVQVVPTPR
jgi:hypothetical protein